jgi:NADH-quinone oxidoreductase subunit B
MLMDAIIKLHEQIGNTKLGAHRAAEIKANEALALTDKPTAQMKGLLR